MRLAQILDIEMGEKYLYSHQNGGEIFSVKLRRGDLCNPIGVDLFEIRDTIYGTRVCGIGKIIQENFLPPLLLENRKLSLPL